MNLSAAPSRTQWVSQQSQKRPTPLQSIYFTFLSKRQNRKTQQGAEDNRLKHWQISETTWSQQHILPRPFLLPKIAPLLGPTQNLTVGPGTYLNTFFFYSSWNAAPVFMYPHCPTCTRLASWFTNWLLEQDAHQQRTPELIHPGQYPVYCFVKPHLPTQCLTVGVDVQMTMNCLYVRRSKMDPRPHPARPLSLTGPHSDHKEKEILFWKLCFYVRT